MKRFLFSALIIVFVLSSCGLSRNSDEENLNDLIMEYDDILLSTYDSGEEEDAAKTAVTPLFWYRELADADSFAYDIHLDINGDSASAVIKGTFPGVLNVYYVNDSLDTVVMEKDFSDTLVRSVTFVRDTLKEYHGGWRVDRISGAEIFTQTPALMHIDSVKLFKTGIIDTVIRGIDDLFAKNEIIALPSGELIDITIYSPDTTGFFFIHSALKRSRFTYSAGVYTGTFRVPLLSGAYRVAFDGITEGSLMETDSAYSAYGWMFPYRSE